MSGPGDSPHAPPRRSRREPLRAAPAPDDAPEPTVPADRPGVDRPGVDRRPRCHAPIAGVVLVLAVAALVLAAARAPGAPDDIAAPDFDLVRTETSAPRISGLASTPAAPGAVDETHVPPATLGSVGDIVMASDGVPATGGYTDLIRSHFGPLTVEAIVIVQCESGFDPLAVGENTNGTRDHGLFQINDVHEKTFEAITGHPWTDVYDPTLNTSFAKWLHGHAGGWGPWRCNRNLEAFQADVEPGAVAGTDE